MNRKKGKKVKAQVLDVELGDNCGDCCNCNGNKCKDKYPVNRTIGYKLDEDISIDTREWMAIIENICIVPKKSIASISVSANGTGNITNATTVLFKIVVNDVCCINSATPQIIYNDGNTNVNLWNITICAPIILKSCTENHISIEWSITCANDRCAKINICSEPLTNNFSFYLQYQ